MVKALTLQKASVVCTQMKQIEFVHFGQCYKNLL